MSLALDKIEELIFVISLYGEKIRWKEDAFRKDVLRLSSINHK